VITRRIKAFINTLKAKLGRDIKARIIVDAAPIMEKPLAAETGLGFIGKNSLLIRPKSGSFSLLAELLWDVDLVEADPSKGLGLISRETSPAQGSCGSCQQCRVGCPTGAIVEDYVIDARKCISYLTIEKRGPLSIWERQALGEWLFGCDVCQDVCPFNHAPLKHGQGAEIEELSRRSGCGPSIELNQLLAIKTDEMFLLRFAGTPLMRAKRAGLLRNGACVAVNTNSIQCLPNLKKNAESDSSDIIRQHSLWALIRLGSMESALGNGLSWRSLKATLNKALADPSSIVANEAEILLQNCL